MIDDFGPNQFTELQAQDSDQSIDDLLTIKQGEYLLILEKDSGNGWEFGVRIADRFDPQSDYFSSFGNFPASFITHTIELPPEYRKALSSAISSSAS